MRWVNDLVVEYVLRQVLENCRLGQSQMRCNFFDRKLSIYKVLAGCHKIRVVWRNAIRTWRIRNYGDWSYVVVAAIVDDPFDQVFAEFRAQHPAAQGEPRGDPVKQGYA